jgi:hypothetical protein
MAKKSKGNSIYIYRSEAKSLDKQEQVLDQWMADNASDKVLVLTEDNNGFIISEEKDAVVCMEYTEYKE